MILQKVISWLNENFDSKCVKIHFQGNDFSGIPNFQIISELKSFPSELNALTNKDLEQYGFSKRGSFIVHI